MQAEEANQLKDKMSSLSLNSGNSNLVAYSVLMNKDSFKDEGRKLRS